MNNIRYIPYKNKEAIVYTRSDRSFDEVSLQISITNKFIELNGLNMKKMFVDNEISNQVKDRVQLTAAREYLQNHEGAIIIVTSLDRLYGASDDVEEFLKFLANNKCNLVSIEEKIDTLNNGYDLKSK